MKNTTHRRHNRRMMEGLSQPLFQIEIVKVLWGRGGSGESGGGGPKLAGGMKSLDGVVARADSL